MKKITIIESITVIYTILFLYTGISKLMDFSVFKEQISESPIIKPFASLIAIGLPIFEILIVLMLIIPKWRLKGLFISLGLMITFTAYIIFILNFNKELPCSCGGILQQLSWPQHLILNCFFIGMAIVAIMLSKKIKIKQNSQIGSLLSANSYD